MRHKIFSALIAMVLSVAWASQVPVSAEDNMVFDETKAANNDIQFHRPGSEGTASSGVCTSVPSSVELTNVPDPWRSLIEKTAPGYPEADMRLVAATLWTENRGWPDFEKDWAVSSAGAQGPWQFIPGTWASMGTDGDKDGVKDPNNPLDAVHAAFKHQLGSTGKPIIEGYNNDIEAGLSLKFNRSDTNLLYYMAKYNGSGAPDGVALKDFPRGQNADYVLYGYYLLTSGFTETWDETTGKSKPLSGSGDSSGSTGSAASCTSSETGVVNSAGFSFPLGMAKSAIDYLPCEKATCHHDGSAAADMFAPVGTKVFAIEDGTIETVKDGYDGISGCYSINFAGKSGWKYWIGHIKNPSVNPNQSVKAGSTIAEVGPTECAKMTMPHLHIDRGDPKGANGGYDDHRSSTLIPLLNQLYEELP